MKSVSVRDLRYNFKEVELLLRQGEDVQITKRRKVIGRIVPEAISPPVLPDFAGRIRELQGDAVLAISGAQLIQEDRDRY